MTIKSQKLTNGLLTIGETASTQEWGGQVRAVKLDAEYDEEDGLPVLSGEELDGDETKTEKLSGTVLDDYSAAGSIFVFSKTNEGKILPFTWEPNSDDGTLRIKGKIKMRQISIGGDVKTRNENDFEFKVIGETTTEAIA
ncbi:major tail protein [Arthrobacter phage Atraxa]|uniref:Major tail protein n=1 Tax=Arthrobacter phage Atraxa TaxID=2419947 RepID=A0A3G2KD76_9CAUD|nr:major tail protein [Arthrobacter phage Atraxa]AYN56964.1 major tail protein [Arthrobacter phage Atraxa]AYN59072.1 major tail protein [Arthrobacter phage Sputnik]